MPVFEIQTPDGRILDIEAGDEATAIRGAQEWVSQNPAASAGSAAPASPQPSPGGGVGAVAYDAASQFGQGFNRGLDSVLNAPYNVADVIANAFGGDLPDAQPIVGRLNEGGQAPQSMAGRIAGVAGETFGTSVIPAAGIYARAAQAAPLVAPAESLAQGVGHTALQSIRAAPAQSAALEVASTAGAGVGQGTAREMGGGPVAETLAALAGGLAPAAIPALNPKLPPRPEILPVADDIEAPRLAQRSAPTNTGQKTEASAASQSPQAAIDETPPAVETPVPPSLMPEPPAPLLGPDGQRVEPLLGERGIYGYIDANGQQFTRQQIEGQREPMNATLQKILQGGATTEAPAEPPMARPDFAREPAYVREKLMPPVDTSPETRTPPTTPEILAASERQDIQVPRGAVSETLRAVTGRLKDIPIIGRPIVRAAERTRQQLSDRKAAIVESVGKSGRWSVGDTVATGMRDWIHQGSRDIEDGLYSEVRKLIRPEVKQPLTRTQKLIDELIKEADEGTLTKFDGVLERLKPGAKRTEGLSYQGLLKLRGEIGDELSTAKLTGDIGEEGWKRAYGALTQDLEDVVYAGAEELRKGTGKRALNEWRKANHKARHIQDERDELAKLVGVRKNEPKPNEAVVDAVIRLANEGPGANIQTLMKAKRRLSKEAWESLSAEALARMGVARDGTFSPNIFINDYSKLSRNGKYLFFGSDGVRQSIDDLVTVASLQKDLAAMGNPSGTAGASFIISMIFGGPSALAYYGGAGALTSAAIGGGAGYGVATWLARPATLKAAGPLAKAWKSLQESGSQTAQLRFDLAVRTFAGALVDEFGGDEKELASEIDKGMRGTNAIAN